MLHWLCCKAQALVLICSSWSWTFATLLHWLEQSGPLCLSIKQVCRGLHGVRQQGFALREAHCWHQAQARVRVPGCSLMPTLLQGLSHLNK